MFSSISWQEFFIVIAFSVLAYYCLTALLLFRTDIVSLLRGQVSGSMRKDDLSLSDSGSEVMGSIQPDEEPVSLRISTNTSQEIQVLSDGDPETLTEVRQSPGVESGAMLIGSVADLLQEVKTLVELIAEYKSPKEEALSLFQTLLLRYPHLRESIYQEPVNLYIYENSKSRFPFSLELDEIRRWWGPGKQRIS